MDYGEKQHFEDPRDNLNSENWAAPERNSRDLGNKILTSNEESANQNQEEKIESLAQIVELAPAPGAENTPVSSPEKTSAEVKGLQVLVGNHFNEDLEKEIDRAENELTQTGNICKFYNEIRGEGEMSEVARGNWAA